MSSFVHSLAGAAFLLTGSTAAIAQYANAPAEGQSVQVAATTTTDASNSVVIAEQPQSPNRSGLTDNRDPNGGYAPDSTAAARVFFESQY